ncbi:MAG: MBG domain-containing protein, partial [Fibromonadales bacterium]|nr:MBG domain-containing protein [Fibromonadales bacterium]
DFEITKTNPILVLTQESITRGQNLPLPELSCYGVGDDDGEIECAEPVVFEYAEFGTNIWSETPPTATGHYQVRASVGESENYSAFSTTAEFHIEEKPSPEVTLTQNNITYGSQPNPQVTGAPEGTTVTLEYSVRDADEWSETKPENANIYSVRVFVSESEDYNSITVTTHFSILKASAPALSNPSGLTAKVGDPLHRTTLPEQWTWDTPDKVFAIGDIGNFIVSATYAPTTLQLNNYNYAGVNGYNAATETITRNLTVSVTLVPDDVIILPIADRRHTGAKIEPMVLVGIYLGADRILLPSNAYTVTYSSNTDIGTANVSIIGTGVYESITATGTFKITEHGITSIPNRDNRIIGVIGVQTIYYDLKGTPLGTTKPAIPGVYIEKQGKQTKRIVVR